MTIRKRMFDMETFVISVFTNFISNRLEKPYGAVCSKIKSLFFKLCLKHDLIKLVDQYKNEPYYNSFDKFLSEGQYAENIVMHSLNSQETIKSSRCDIPIIIKMSASDVSTNFSFNLLFSYLQCSSSSQSTHPSSFNVRKNGIQRSFT